MKSPYASAGCVLAGAMPGGESIGVGIGIGIGIEGIEGIEAVGSGGVGRVRGGGFDTDTDTDRDPERNQPGGGMPNEALHQTGAAWEFLTRSEAARPGETALSCRGAEVPRYQARPLWNRIRADRPTRVPRTGPMPDRSRACRTWAIAFAAAAALGGGLPAGAQDGAYDPRDPGVLEDCALADPGGWFGGAAPLAGFAQPGAPAWLDVPAGAEVSIVVRRVEGARPRVAAVRDGLGRSLPFSVRRGGLRGVVLDAMVIDAPGGLFVEVATDDGAYGMAAVSVRARGGHVTTDVLWEDRSLVLSGAESDVLTERAQALGLDVVEVQDGFAIVDLPPNWIGCESSYALWLLDQLGGGILAEPNGIALAPEGSQANAIVLGSDLGRADFDRQRALYFLHAPAAHRVSTGAGTVVAVLDTGVDASHPLLAGRVLPGRDFVDDDDDPREVLDGFDDDGDGQTDEGYGHGTFVAGVVLASAPGARILPVRVLGTDARGSASDVAAGIDWAVEHGAEVVNLSLGMLTYTEVLAQAVHRALDAGVLVLAAAGNRGVRSSVDFPASIPGVIGVTALGSQGHRAGFANGNRWLTVAAPGTGIIGPYPQGRWATGRGTSFATALASGGAALVGQRHPDLTPDARRAIVVGPNARARLGLDLLRLVR